MRLLPRILLRRQDSMQSVTFLAGAELYYALAFYVFYQALENLASQVGAGHFAATEKNRRLDLVAFVEETQHVILFGLVIMVVHIDAELYFLDRDRFLVLLGLAFLFLLLVEKFPVIHDAANGRHSSGRNLNQVQVLLAGHFERFEGRHNTDLFAFVPNHSDFTRSNAIVRADKTFIDTVLRRPEQRPRWKIITC